MLPPNSSPITARASTLTFQRVFGEGREKQLELAQKIIQERIDPLYDQSRMPFLTPAHKCRLLCADQDDQKALGLLICHPASSKEMQNNILEVKAFYATDQDGLDQTFLYHSHILKRILKMSEKHNVKAIDIEVSPKTLYTINFFKENEFEIVKRLPHSLFFKRLLSSEPQGEKKRKREEERRIDEGSRAKYARTNSTHSSRPVETNMDNKRKIEEVDHSFHSPHRQPAHKRSRYEEESPRRGGTVTTHCISAKSSPVQRVPLPSVTIQRKYLNLIIQEKKTIEGRINSGIFAKLREGQNIQFFNGTTKVICLVTRINQYRSFEAMLRTEGFRPCLPDVPSLEKAIEVYNNIRTYPERAARSGVLAIHLQVTK